MLYYLVAAIYLLVCFLLLVVVLLQQGRGGDIASAFGGGGSSQTAFGARQGATVLAKATAVLGALFMIGAIALASLGQRSGSLLRGVPAPAAPAQQTTPAQPAPAPGAPAQPAQPPAVPESGSTPPATPPVESPRPPQD